MKHLLESLTRRLALATLLLLGLGSASTHAAGLLTPVGVTDQSLEIRDHLVDVTIQDGFVVTNVEQVFRNPHSHDLEAVYAFPIPDQAAVSSFTFWIDGQPVVGEVLEKARAREIYEAEKQAGREAGITEQHGYKRFEVSVTPVRANSDARIRLQYIQPVDLDTGIGRYVYPLEEGGTDEQKLSFWTANETVSEHFRFTLTVRASVPVDAVRLPNIADARVTQLSDGEWQVVIERRGGLSVAATNGDTQPMLDEATVVEELTEGLAEAATDNAVAPATSPSGQSATRLDQDLVVYWRLAPNLPGSVELMAYREPGESRGTFMLVMTPGDDLQPIAEGRDWVFVLDQSGSMAGKISTLADAVSKAITQLQPSDRFRIVSFNNSAREVTPGWVTVSEQSVRQYADLVFTIQAGGGTNLFAGIETALRTLDRDRTAGVVLVTDGVANVGETQRKGFLKLLERYDARLFTFIMGNEANRPLLKSLATHSNGFARSISNNDDIVGKILEATSRISHEAMHDVSVSMSGVRTSGMTPARIASVYRGEQIVVLGEYWNAGEVIVDLEARISGRKVNYSTRFQLPETATDLPELERLWAYSRIQDLENQQELLGEDQDREQAITDLGVQYGIVSGNTSMIVLREEQFAAHGIDRNNRARVEKELNAQQARAAEAVTQRQVSQSQPTSPPMFNNSRPSYSGGGSMDLLWVLLLLPLAVFGRRRAG